MILNIKNLSKKFRKVSEKKGLIVRLINKIFRTGSFLALKDINLQIDKGEILGLIGPNASGKSTLLRIITGIYYPNSGVIEKNGKILGLINLKYGLIECLSMKDNILILGVLMGMKNKELAKKYSSIVNFTELAEHVNTKIRFFSEGMKERLIFGIAFHCDYDLLVIDEIFSTADNIFIQKCLRTIEKHASEGKSIVLVSHDLNLVKENCSRVILLSQARIIENGNPSSVISKYKTK